jgi:hypothetical protein
MKWCVFLLFVCGFTVGQNQEVSVTLTKAATNGLIAHYPLDGNAADVVGGHAGTMEGGGLRPAPDRLGRAGRALRFTNESYIDIPIDINAAEFPALTMCAWVLLEGPANDGVVYQVLSHDDGGFDRSLGVDHRGGGVGWSAFAGSGDVLGSKIMTRKWTFLAVAYDQDAEAVTLYVNDKKFSLSGSTGLGLATLRIGGNPTYGEAFPGIIDEVRIYGRVLNDDEVKQLLSYKEP